MVAPTSPEEAICLPVYTPGWRMGTGLPVSVSPGRYRITDEQTDNGSRFLVLDDEFRIRWLPPADPDMPKLQATEPQSSPKGSA